MSSTSLIKTILHKSLAEGVYRDIVTKNSSYYYILGKTLNWNVNDDPPYPIDSYSYEKLTRSEIITLKQIKTTDVSFVIPRVNWETGTIYDMYDDAYSTELMGLNIIDGGNNFTSIPTITVSGGNGSGASFTAEVDVELGKIITINTVSGGSGYTTLPTVTVTGGGGSGAILEPVLNISPSGKQKLEDCVFYVVTDEYNVYKCLDNNNNSPSTVKPTGTQIDPIVTVDGYVWKYMYNVPISLRNKFLTTTHMPVVSALTNQFYSNGRLDTIIVNNRGTNYTSANIIVLGDGYQEEDPLFIDGVVVQNGGTGYTTPTITISPPFSSGSPFIPEADVSVGQKLYNTNLNYYEVTRSGKLSTIEPTHRNGSVQNGTALLKYVGATAKATATVNSGVITSINFKGSVKQINTITGGSGYTSPPTVVVNRAVGDTTGTGAQAVAVMNNDSVLYIKVIDKGENYTIDPDIKIGNDWVANLTITSQMVGNQYVYDNRLYTTLSTGTFGATGPTFSMTTVAATALVAGTQYTITSLGTTDFTLVGAPVNQVGTTFIATGAGTGTGLTSRKDTGTNGTVSLKYAGIPAGAESERQYGSGYSSVPTITITGTNTTPAVVNAQVSKSAARLIPIIENKQITGVSVDNPGIGYTYADISVIGNIGSSSAELTASLNIGNIESLQANNELLTVPGTINAIKIISGGYNYGVAKVAIIGDGYGAEATATVDAATGQISKINIIKPGQNYTFARVIIYGNGNGASARAILSPTGGHGKSSPDEFYARTLMFYNNISGDLNQGVSVNNDYRQIGIIKNPRKYGETNLFDGIIGSGCWKVEAEVNPIFAPDQLLDIKRGTGWSAAATVFANDQIYYGDNLYVVSTGGETGIVAPTHSYGAEVNGTAVLQYIGSPKRYYRIVSISGTSVLLQSLDNDTPSINDVLSYKVGNLTYTLKLDLVNEPTVDKYSGQLMFIDNKNGFTPSNDETVILRTIIKF